MRGIATRIPRSRAWGPLFAVGSVVCVTVLIATVPGVAHIATAPMLYLVAVLAAAALFGLVPAILAALSAFLAFNWTFVEPRYTLAVRDPAAYLTLFLFLVTAAVTGTLAGLLRKRARDAEERQRDAVVLYDIARLLNADDVEAALPAAGRRLLDALDLSDLVIQPADPEVPRFVIGDRSDLAALPISAAGGQLLAGGPSAERPARWVTMVSPYRSGRDSSAPTHAVPLSLGERRIGTLLVRRRAALPLREPDERLLAAAGAQLAQAIERRRLRRDALDTELFRRTDEVKTALLGAVSHDLRTPLASIVAAAGSLRQRDVDWTEEQREGFVVAIEQEARRLDRLVGQLLDLSRIEAGALTTQKGWYDLRALIDEIVGRLRPVTRQHTVHVDVAEDLPPIQLDYVQLDQVLSNLLDNAAKYAPAGSAIEVTARLEPGAVRIEVSDRGPGIPPGEAHLLFAPFRRLRRDLGISGTGLGLAIARRLIEASGGSIGVEPRTGGGARFVVTLPR